MRGSSFNGRRVAVAGSVLAIGLVEILAGRYAVGGGLVAAGLGPVVIARGLGERWIPPVVQAAIFFGAVTVLGVVVTILGVLGQTRRPLLDVPLGVVVTLGGAHLTAKALKMRGQLVLWVRA